MYLYPALGRQRKEDLCEFRASLACVVSARLDSARLLACFVETGTKQRNLKEGLEDVAQ